MSSIAWRTNHYVLKMSADNLYNIESMANASHTFSGNDLARPAKELPFKILRDLGRMLYQPQSSAGHWEMLAEDLGYSHEETKHFGTMASMRQEATPGEVMLRDWAERSNGRTLFVLHNALARAERQDCVEYLEKEIYNRILCMELMVCVKHENSNIVQHLHVQTRVEASLLDSLTDTLDHPVQHNYHLLDTGVTWKGTLAREFKGRQLMLLKVSTAMDQDPTIDSSVGSQNSSNIRSSRRNPCAVEHESSGSSRSSESRDSANSDTSFQPFSDISQLTSRPRGPRLPPRKPVANASAITSRGVKQVQHIGLESGCTRRPVKSCSISEPNGQTSILDNNLNRFTEPKLLKSSLNIGKTEPFDGQQLQHCSMEQSVNMSFESQQPTACSSTDSNDLASNCSTNTIEHNRIDEKTLNVRNHGNDRSISKDFRKMANGGREQMRPSSTQSESINDLDAGELMQDSSDITDHPYVETDTDAGSGASDDSITFLKKIIRTRPRPTGGNGKSESSNSKDAALGSPEVDSLIDDHEEVDVDADDGFESAEYQTNAVRDNDDFETADYQTTELRDSEFLTSLTSDYNDFEKSDNNDFEKSDYNDFENDDCNGDSMADHEDINDPEYQTVQKRVSELRQDEITEEFGTPNYQYRPPLKTGRNDINDDFESPDYQPASELVQSSSNNDFEPPDYQAASELRQSSLKIDFGLPDYQQAGQTGQHAMNTEDLDFDSPDYQPCNDMDEGVEEDWNDSSMTFVTKQPRFYLSSRETEHVETSDDFVDKKLERRVKGSRSEVENIGDWRSHNSDNQIGLGDGRGVYHGNDNLPGIDSNSSLLDKTKVNGEIGSGNKQIRDFEDTDENSSGIEGTFGRLRPDVKEEDHPQYLDFNHYKQTHEEIGLELNNDSMKEYVRAPQIGCNQSRKGATMGNHEAPPICSRNPSVENFHRTDAAYESLKHAVSCPTDSGYVGTSPDLVEHRNNSKQHSSNSIIGVPTIADVFSPIQGSQFLYPNLDENSSSSENLVSKRHSVPIESTLQLTKKSKTRHTLPGRDAASTHSHSTHHVHFEEPDTDSCYPGSNLSSWSTSTVSSASSTSACDDPSVRPALPPRGSRQSSRSATSLQHLGQGSRFSASLHHTSASLQHSSPSHHTSASQQHINKRSSASLQHMGIGSTSRPGTSRPGTTRPGTSRSECGHFKSVIAGHSRRPSLDGLLADDRLFTHYNTLLNDFPGWSPRESEYTVEKTMHSALGNDGVYILWYPRMKKTLVISITYCGTLLHYRVKTKVVEGGTLQYYIEKPHFFNDVLELLSHYQSHGLEIPDKLIDERRRADFVALLLMQCPIRVQYNQGPAVNV